MRGPREALALAFGAAILGALDGSHRPHEVEHASEERHHPARRGEEDPEDRSTCSCASFVRSGNDETIAMTAAPRPAAAATIITPAMTFCAVRLSAPRSAISPTSSTSAAISATLPG